MSCVTASLLLLLSFLVCGSPADPATSSPRSQPPRTANHPRRPGQVNPLKVLDSLLRGYDRRSTPHSTAGRYPLPKHLTYPTKQKE